jgi:glycine/sarcosine N-methyltransferase
MASGVKQRPEVGPLKRKSFSPLAYDNLILSRPSMQHPGFYEDENGERIVHQVWRWQDDQYEMHLYLTIPIDAGMARKALQFEIPRTTAFGLKQCAASAGFSQVE